jgi:Fic family protein
MVTVVNNIREYIKQSNYIESVRSLAEIDQSLKAWNFLKDQIYPTEDIILRVHRLIMWNFQNKRPGKFRESNVQVGNQLCPSYFDVPKMIEDWIDDMMGYRLNDPKVMHVRFEKIHPFLDGNGRTGRMLMWWHETHLDRVPTYISYESRWEYYEWFE